MTHIQLRGVQKWFGPVQVIKDLNLDIAHKIKASRLAQIGAN